MIDVLAITYDFVQQFAKGFDMPGYESEQIVQGFQNMASLPEGTHEFCTITLLSSIKHGSDWHYWTNVRKTDPEPFEQHLKAVIEDIVQIDMCSAEPFTQPQVTQERAQALQLAANSNIATEFYEHESGGDLTCLYAEDVQNLSGFDETKTYSARYMLRLHLGMKAHAVYKSDYFIKIAVRPMAVDGSNLGTPGTILTGDVDVITQNLKKEE